MVKLDVHDLGGHLDTTFRAWSAPLAAKVAALLRVVCLVFSLSLDVHGKLRVLRTKFIPAALQGIKASLLSHSSHLKLRAASVRGC